MRGALLGTSSFGLARLDSGFQIETLEELDPQAQIAPFGLLWTVPDFVGLEVPSDERRCRVKICAMLVDPVA